MSGNRDDRQHEPLAEHLPTSHTPSRPIRRAPDDERPSASYRAILEERRRQSETVGGATGSHTASRIGAVPPPGRTSHPIGVPSHLASPSSRPTHTPSRPIGTPSRPRDTGTHQPFTVSRPLTLPSRPIPAMVPQTPKVSPRLVQQSPTRLLRLVHGLRSSLGRTIVRQASVLGAILLALVLVVFSAVPANSGLTAPWSQFGAAFSKAFFPTSTPTLTLTPPAAIGVTPTQTSVGGGATSTPPPTNVPGNTPTTAAIYTGVGVAGDPTNFYQYEQDAGKGASIVMLYQQWGDANPDFQPATMDAIRRHGSLPLISWEPWNEGMGVTQPTYTLQNIINGAFDNYIIRYAQEAKAWGHPFFLDFAHEMNGDWFSYSEHTNGNAAGQYVPMYQHVWNVFRAQGVTNVTWVWAPNVEYNAESDIRAFYPGDAYVDWVGIDGYNWGNEGGHQWESFATLFTQTYHELLSMTAKPLMIAEMASTEVGGTKSDWITDAFVTQIPQNFPQVKAFIWFNYDKEQDWRIESSGQSQSAFANAMKSSLYLSNTLANVATSPIPEPPGN